MRQLTPCRLRGVQIYRCASRRRLLASAAQLRSYSSEPPSPPTGPSPPQQKAPPTGPSPPQQKAPPTGPSPPQQKAPPTGPSPPQQKAPPTGPSPPQQKGPAGLVKERALVALQHAGELGRQWGQRSARAAAATADYWWGRYEAFVGLNEVRQAQTKVTEAEAAFMVARGVVREAHGGLEALQGRLKEVRDRLDRVSREEGHYLELATMEHKLLQEERRLRTAYEGAEGAERERFALFSAAVRESHEKERARAERTKNWSVIGSVLGAVIGVMGSTYVNRVRLQELKHLLLEAQKGPESLQEALRVQEGNHRSQQDQLRQLIASLRAALDVDPRDPGLTRLQQEVAKVEGQLQAVRKLLETRPRPAETAERRGPEAAAGRLEDGQRALGERIRMSSVYSAAFSYTAAAIGAAAVYLLLRGAG